MQYKLYLFAFLALILALPARADVVRPALIEISLFTSGAVEIEIRASVEALLTGINGRYTNTVEAPNADEYDRLRELEAPDLRKEFISFEETLVEGVDLRLDGQSVPLRLGSVDIPEPGYTKVPRISVITLHGQVSGRDRQQLTWYYPMRFGDHASRVRQVDEANELWHWSDHQWIREAVYTEPYPLDEIFTSQPWWKVFHSYTMAGFQHIVPFGMDHILFVIGIFLLSRHMKPLLWQVTMFTLAHSITLTLSMLDIFSLSPRLVEPLIALSIAYVAIENLFGGDIRTRRLWIVFGFGLLHGLGFAEMLAEFGMPRDGFALALVSFNVGIELGQLAVIAVAWLVLAAWIRDESAYRKLVVLPVSVLISLVGLYWFWERVEWAV